MASLRKLFNSKDTTDPWKRIRVWMENGKWEEMFSINKGNIIVQNRADNTFKLCCVPADIRT